MNVMYFDYSECTSNIDAIASLHSGFSAILEEKEGRGVIAEF
ncbi:MAG: hypothetical protein WCJ03_12255 [Bacteroidales bacterium]